MRIGWKRRKNYKLWFYILSSECGHLGYKEDGGSEEPHSMFLFPPPASRLSDGIHAGLSRNLDDEHKITIFHVAGLPVLWWELLCQPAGLQWKDDERDVAQAWQGSQSNHHNCLLGARVLTMARNQSRGMIREKSVEERGGGGQKEDEKVLSFLLVLDPWFWILDFGSLILDPWLWILDPVHWLYSLILNPDAPSCSLILILDPVSRFWSCVFIPIFDPAWSWCLQEGREGARWLKMQQLVEHWTNIFPLVLFCLLFATLLHPRLWIKSNNKQWNLSHGCFWRKDGLSKSLQLVSLSCNGLHAVFWVG